MDYWILKAEKDHELAKEVREYLRKGWVPYGGIAADGQWLYQAMVKPADEPPAAGPAQA